jgi:nucleotide-binding universal stress UspA family protein
MRYSAIIVGTDGSASALKAGASDMTATLVKGDPGRAVVTTASERAADLIVVGNRGINPLSGRLLGSVRRACPDGHRATSASCIR